MTDILIRDVAKADLDKIDSKASALGLSRVEYLRRRIEQDARRSESAVTVDTLASFTLLSADLLDEQVIGEAWN